MARRYEIQSDWLYKDPIELDDIERGQFTQDDEGTYHISAQNKAGEYWAPRTRLTQTTDTKPTEKDTWPPHNYDYNASDSNNVRGDVIRPGLQLVIRTINVDTDKTTYGKHVTGALGDIVCDLDATLIAANQRSSKGILSPYPDTRIDGGSPIGSQNSGKTWRVKLERTDPDNSPTGMSLLQDGQHYHISIGNYLQ